MYLLLASHGRNNSRYVKLPRDWMNLGYMCGLLEDLVVVMRTLSQLNISKTHLVDIPRLITNFVEYMHKEESDSNHRFLFLSDLVLNSHRIIDQIIVNSILSQGNSKRIGIYTPLDDSVLKISLPGSHNCYANLQMNIRYIYAIQGIYGMSYDPRVTNPITTRNSSYSKYAIHFTKKEIAYNIYHNVPTTSHRLRSNGLPIYPGTICRFDRHIHAISDIEKISEPDSYSVNSFSVNSYFVISQKLKNIRDRMSHGISDEISRPKYEAGLIIDIESLVQDYESSKINTQIIINEIGTLLISSDIPRKYIIGLIITDEDLNKFWAGPTYSDSPSIQLSHIVDYIPNNTLSPDSPDIGLAIICDKCGKNIHSPGFGYCSN
jgi:hypothetical protein